MNKLVGGLTALAWVLIGCGGSGQGPTRSYRLASTGMQSVLNADPFNQLTPANLSTDVDVVSIHQDFYGLPWDEFEAGQPPPAPWTAAMDDLVQQAGGKDVFLSLQLVSGAGRQFLAAKSAINPGRLTAPVEQWSVPCYNFATASDGASKKAAYLRYVDWMVRKFNPRWVNVAIEINFFQSCGTAWAPLVDVSNAAYDTVKAAKSDAIAFPSIEIDALYGYDASTCQSGMSQPQCFDANYAGIAALKRDRFAISTYPYITPGIGTLDRLPDDWLTRGGDRGGERTLIAETGWNSDSIQVMQNGNCTTVVPSSEVSQRDYLDRVLSVAQARNMELVTWWSNRDVLPAPVMACNCTFDAGWCNLLSAARGQDAELIIKLFGTMGIRNYGGTLKSLTGARWQAAQQLHLAR